MTAMPAPAGPQAAALAALVLGAVAMGISPIFVRFAAADVGPFASAFWRVALALPALYAWMRIEEAGRPGGRRGPAFAPGVLFAGLAFTGDLFFWHLAILGTTVANATFLATTAPIVVVLATWAAYGRRPARATVTGLALCLAGGTALVGQSLSIDPGRALGDAYGLATALFFGLYFLGVERARAAGAGAARVTFELSLVTAAALLAVALVANLAAGQAVLPRSAGGVAALVAMALVSHAGGQGLLAVALGRLPATFSSLVIFLEAVAAAGFGWLILREALAPVQILGGALILVGIWWARPRPARARDDGTLAGEQP
ncbi:MAG TPA: DMT family transporter [Salinarimonas sp.]|nr:DMT family transporter [Salinarimonas sp.]